MARTAVTLTDLTVNAATAIATTAADATNGHSVDVQGACDRIWLEVKNTAVSSKNLTVKAGDYPPALAAGVGDFVIAFAASAEKRILLEGNRFLQDDGTILIDLAAGFTGTIAAYRVPRGS